MTAVGVDYRSASKAFAEFERKGGTDPVQFALEYAQSSNITVQLSDQWFKLFGITLHKFRDVLPDGFDITVQDIEDFMRHHAITEEPTVLAHGRADGFFIKLVSRREAEEYMRTHPKASRAI